MNNEVIYININPNANKVVGLKETDLKTLIENEIAKGANFSATDSTIIDSAVTAVQDQENVNSGVQMSGQSDVHPEVGMQAAPTQSVVANEPINTQPNVVQPTVDQTTVNSADMNIPPVVPTASDVNTMNQVPNVEGGNIFDNPNSPVVTESVQPSVPQSNVVEMPSPGNQMPNNVSNVFDASVQEAMPKPEQVVDNVAVDYFSELSKLKGQVDIVCENMKEMVDYLKGLAAQIEEIAKQCSIDNQRYANVIDDVTGMSKAA